MNSKDKFSKIMSPRSLVEALEQLNPEVDFEIKDWITIYIYGIDRQNLILPEEFKFLEEENILNSNEYRITNKGSSVVQYQPTLVFYPNG